MLRLEAIHPARGADVTGASSAGTMLFLTTVEAAAMLRVAKSTLERMRVQGTGPRFLKVGPGKRSRVLYRQTEIDAWLEKQSFGSTSEYGR
jgi:excisionase family DNA binding protein